MSSIRLLRTMLMIAGVLFLAGMMSTVQAANHLTRVELVRKLVTVSSGAKQVEASGVEEAQKLHAQARDLFAQAENESDPAKQKALLDEATKTMFKAIRAAKADQVLASKYETDYKNKLASMDALMSAHERVVNEKNLQDEKKPVVDKVNGLLKYAASLAREGKYKEALTETNKAYVTLKTSIESMRGGDTLVRSLDFETVEEEYAYELDRNDTHAMLVKMLAKKKFEKLGSMRERIAKYLEEARALRQEAEKLAEKGAYEEAIPRLESSTKNYVRAIRGSGVYIPG